MFERRCFINSELYTYYFCNDEIYKHLKLFLKIFISVKIYL